MLLPPERNGGVATGGAGSFDLSSLSLLEGLPAPVKELVMAAFVACSYGFGDEIVRQGDHPDGFYVLTSGRARVVVTEHGAEVPLALLGPGDTFGEMGLLEGSPRSATVRASAPSTTARLEPALFRAIATRHPEVADRLRAQARARRARPLLGSHGMFSALSGPQLDAVATRMQEVRARAGEVLFSEDGPPGPMYVVVSGRLKASRAGIGDVSYFRAGDVFGEASLHNSARRAATVEAVSDALLMALGAADFAALEAEDPAFKQAVAQQVALYRAAAAPIVPLDFVPASANGATNEGPVPTPAPTQPGAGEPDQTLAVAGSTGWRPGARRHVRHMRQLDESDCGAVCLAMLCRHFGHPVPVRAVREAVGTGIDGTSLSGIQRGGEAIGLAVKAAKYSRDRLDELPLPAITHWHGDHWVVVDQVAAARVHLADPGTDSRWVSRDDFLSNWNGYVALARPTERLKQVPLPKTELGWLGPILSPYRSRLALVVVLSLVASVLQMMVPLVTGAVIDDVIPHHNYGRLYFLMGLLLVLQMAALLTGYARAKVMARAAVKIDTATLDHVAGRMLGLPLRYYESRRTGEIEGRLDSMRQIREFVLQEGSYALSYAAQVVVALILMLITSWALGLAWLVTVPVYVVLARVWAARMRPAYAELQEGLGRYRARRIDSIRGIETIKALGREEPLRRSMLKEFNDITARVLRVDMTAITYGSASQFVTFVFLLVFLLLGALEVLHGDLSVGGLVAFNSLALLASGPLMALLGMWDSWQLGAVNLNRLRDVLDQPLEQPEGGDLREVPSLEGRMSIKGLSFQYPSSSVAVVSGVNLDIKPGTRVAFVGRSGSGKSTLLRCLSGLLQPSEGAVLFDGVDIRTVNLVSLRRRIGTVPQQPYVFDGTIAGNIAFGEDAPDMEAVRAAAEIADAHTFIERLPLGYRTRVGEGGMRLSGGQSQRIAIARAVYHQPPVLLLDEATSALDSESERAVTENLRRLSEGRTTFLVAHRLSTVRDADVIVVLDAGRVVEMGTHDELLARGGLYVHLYGQQLGT